VVAPLVKIGVTAVLIGAQMAIGAARKIEGPRLDSTKVTLAEYGTALQDFYGIRRLEGCPLIWADDLREKKETSKTKGGKYAEYKYFADFAVAIAGHEIEAVSRIWMDNHLVYQRTHGGPVSPVAVIFGAYLTGRPAKLIYGKNMRIYHGTDDQEPDPMIESWFEDHDDFGADCTPAFRGTAYIAFEGLPVEKFGNRIPTVTVEAISAKTDAFVFDEVPGIPPQLSLLNQFVFSPDYSKFLSQGLDGSDSVFEIWDVPTRTKLYGGELSGALFATSVGLDNDGNLYTAGSAGAQQQLFRYGPTGGLPIVLADVANAQSGSFILRDGSGAQYLGTTAFSFTNSYFGPLEPFGVSAYDPGSPVKVVFYVEDGYGDIWSLARDSNAGTTTIHFHRHVNYSGRVVGDDHSITVAASGAHPELFAVHNDEAGNFLVSWDGGRLYVVDDTTFTITDTVVWGHGITGNQARFFNHPPGDPTIWIGPNEVSTATGELLRSIDPNDWSADATGEEIYDPINHALISAGATDVYWLYLDRVGSNGVTLGSILEAEGALVGLEIDGSDLDQTVKGYSITQGPVRDRIAPLLDIHDSIIRPHGFDLEGLKHSSTALGTINVGDFVREGDAPRYEIDEAQAPDLPQRMEVKFADSTSDQQTNNVIASRHLDSSDSVRVQPIDLSTYVDTPDGMQQKAERFLRAQWNRRATVKNGITAKHLAVEPGDVYNLNLDGVVWTAIAERLTFSARTPKIDCEWRRTFASTLGSGSGAGMTGREPDVIIIPGPTKGFVLDIPLVEDADNDANPQLYYAAGGYGLSWPGASVFEGDVDGNNYAEWQAVASPEKAVWGFASNALADANPNLWDRGNTLTVNTYGTLASSTEAAINADPNLNLIALRNSFGEVELLNFATATLTGTNGTANVYDLTNLKRGRRGTEWAVADHAIGDEFVLVSDLAPVGQGLSEVGTDQFFKAQTFGRDPFGAVPIQVDFEGATLKPYAPARLKVVYDGTDLDCEIIRRTRVGGAWTGGAAIPLSENSEAYEVDVYNGVTFKRTITVTGTNTFTYTAAMAAADSITLPTQPTFVVYQMSDAVGRGFALAA
jgi:hypothetical protein